MSDMKPLSGKPTMGNKTLTMNKEALREHAEGILAQVARLDHKGAALLQGFFASSLSMKPEEREGGLTRFVAGCDDER